MKKLIITMLLTMTALMTASIASAQALDTPSEKSYYPTFLSLNGLTGKEAASECRNMSLMMLVDRTFSEQRYLYTFRFSVEEYQKALSIVSDSIRSEDGETILSTIEQSGIHFNKKAVEYIRYCCSEHIESFYPRELCKWCSLSHANANTAISILAERGVIQAHRQPRTGESQNTFPSSSGKAGPK